MTRETEKKIRAAGILLFVIYLALLSYLLFFSENYGRTEITGYRMNLMPLREIRRFLGSRQILGNWPVFLNVYGNVLLFVPFGAILPLLHRNNRRFLPVLASGALFSVCVEAAQLLSRRGSCDVDDVLLNTLGCAAGYVIFALIKHFAMRKESKPGQT